VIVRVRVESSRRAIKDSPAATDGGSHRHSFPELWFAKPPK